MSSVLDLFGLLGIKTDTRSFLLAQDAVRRLKEDTAAATQTAELGAALAHVHGDAKKAANLIGLTYDQAGAKAAQATGRAERWGTALTAINQGLEVGLKLYQGVRMGVDAIVDAVKASAAQASNAIDLGARLGLAAEAVQELGFAAGQSGTNLDELAGGMGKLANTLDAAKKGGKDAAAALRAVGLSKADAGKPMDETIGKVADAFAKLPDGAKKAALAADLFGQSGVKLIPFLNKGAAGIGAMREEARRLGVVIDGDAAAALQGFGDETDKLHQQFAGIRNQVVIALLPAIMDLVKGAQAWIAANRQLIANALITGGRVLLGIVKGVAVAFQVVSKALGWLANNATLASALIKGLMIAAAAAAGAIAISFAMVAIPLMGIGLAVIGLVKLVKLLIPAARAAGSAFMVALRAVGTALDWVGARFKSLFGWIRDLASGARAIFDAIGAGLKAVFGPIFQWFEDKYNWLKDKGDWIVAKWNEARGAIVGPPEPAPGTTADPKGWSALLRPTTAPAMAGGAVGAAPGSSTTIVQAPVTINATTGATADDIGKAAAAHIGDAARSMKAAKGK